MEVQKYAARVWGPLHSAVNTLCSSPVSCPSVTWSMAETCSDQDTQYSVGQELHGLPGMGHMTTVMCLEYNEINLL